MMPVTNAGSAGSKKRTQLINESRGTLVVRNLRIAAGFFSRLRGLLGTSELPAGNGLLIRPCSSIHMFGMQYSIDAIFVDADNKVIQTVEALTPGQTASCKGAKCVIELPCGTVAATGTGPGDRLLIRDTDFTTP